MVDPDSGRRRNRRLGMQRDAEPGGTDHVEVIGAITHGHGLIWVQTAFIREVEEPLFLGILVDDGLGHRAGQPLAIEFQHIGNRLVEADTPGEVIGKKGKSAGHQGRIGAIGLHRLHQRPATRRQGNRLAPDFFDLRTLQPLEQGDTGVERLLEIELAAHRPVSNFSHLRPEAECRRQLVNAFLLDHGGIHVGDQHLLAPAFAGYHIGVYGPAADDIACQIKGLRRGRLEDIAGDPVAQPVEFAAGLGQYGLGQGRIQFGIGGIGDERENRHGGSNFRERSVTGQRRAVLIAGPTASGKSALALARARASGGLIINADSMQVYDTLRVITARPSVEDEAMAEHRLYGTVPASEGFSTGQWVRAVEATLSGVDPRRELIFVGGTGLYFEALTNGFADVPEISPELTLEVQQEIQTLDEPARMALLRSEDPGTAERLRVADPQRVTRAIAVKRATGRPLSSFQGDQQPGLLEGWALERMVLSPDRDVLRDRIAKRFADMFDNGAVEEVEALQAQKLDPSLPVMKAIGVREISDWLDGLCSREEAVRLATIATQQYAKRQRTWFRNRMGDWPRLGIGGAPLTV